MSNSQLFVLILWLCVPLVISGFADFYELRNIRKIILLFEARILRLEDRFSEEDE